MDQKKYQEKALSVVACHEAGHAVAARLLGCLVLR
jgi:hypothetical protein